MGSRRWALCGVAALAGAAAWGAFRSRPPAIKTPRPAPPVQSAGTRLHDPADRAVFREWFTWLAEAMFFRDTSDLPPDVSDCAGLVRFAYREALRRHDGRWAADLGLDSVPAYGSVRAWTYPHTPLGSALFRIDGGGFAEFADARTLIRHNARQVSRDARDAEPGDLLLFHQPEQDFPFHLMIYLGPSRLEGAPGPYAVYHTGPLDGGSGEIRRPLLAELMRHPEPRWRPLAGNPRFTGVYRWNLLAE